MMRVFEDRPAVRESTPLLLGLVGPSSSGKTFSALRIATGIQRVSGGEIWGIDTEARRMLHYADRFKFRHLAFGAPFGPLDYLAAIQHCVAKGAKTIIVDSMSHEHEGPGGVLEMHAAEVQRLMKAWKTDNENKVKMSAWQKPKGERRRMINSILQLPCNFIFCFRAKEKLKIVPGKDPEQLGFMPQAGEEFVYEMTLKCLLLPGAAGKPTWKPDYPGERMMMKLPEQFVGLFAGAPVLSEDIGQKLAEWAAGTKSSSAPGTAELLTSYAACSDAATLRGLEEERQRAWPTASAAQKKALKEAADTAAKRLADADSGAPDEDPPPPDDGGSLEPLPDGQPL